MRSTASAKASRSRPLRLLAVAGLAVAAALTYAAAAGAQVVACGGIVGPNQKVVLDADLACTAATGGITVVGPATLDLGGHRIGCAAETDRPIGVTLIGKGAQLRNGSVIGCKAGVQVSGEGRHRIEHVTAAADFEAGFRVDSDANTLRDDTGGGTTNGIDFVVRGNRNLLDGDTTVVDGLAPAPIGFRIVGSGNRLRGNTSADHRQFGFHLDFASERSVLHANTATGNHSAGIQVDGQRTSLTGNMLLANTRDGILVTAPAVRLTRNEARDNGAAGIRLAAGVGGAVISHNTALDNDRRDVGASDLADDTPGCSTNRWRANVFATASEACID